MMTADAMRALVGAVSYKPGWAILFDADAEGRPYIQVAVSVEAEAALCPFTGTRAAWKGGKRYLSQHMCRQEIVGACLGAIKDAEAHELHEWFRYKGRAIYNPHLDPDVLAEVAIRRNMNVRENAMTMAEVTA